MFHVSNLLGFDIIESAVELLDVLVCLVFDVVAQKSGKFIRFCFSSNKMIDRCFDKKSMIIVSKFSRQQLQTSKSNFRGKIIVLINNKFWGLQEGNLILSSKFLT